MTTIFVPLDFSDGSLTAYRGAHALASMLDADITVVHVIPRPNPSIVPEVAFDPRTQVNYWDGIEESSEVGRLVREEMDRFLARAPELSPPARVVFRAGDPAETIVECAKVGEADLLVMGTHGRRGLAHFFLGSTAEEVVRAAPCPVVSIKPDQTIPSANA